jgi:HTH-type transcriptional regulator/antitoxin HigA
MIKNKKQYKRTKDLVIQFQNALKQLEEEEKEALIEDREDYEYTYNSYRYQCDELKETVLEYENLVKQKTKILRNKSIEDLYKILIQARIARAWSQSDLAKELDLSPQQIQRYESTNYEGVSLWRVLDILDALELKVELKDIALPDPNYMRPETKIVAIKSKAEEIKQRQSLFAVGE